MSENRNLSDYRNAATELSAMPNGIPKDRFARTGTTADQHEKLIFT
jgi:hypothetical protein